MGASRSTKRRRSGAPYAVAVFIVAALVALPLGSSAYARTTSPSQEEFRASLGTYLQNLQGALTAASRNPQTRAVVAPHLKGDVKALAVARRNLSKLSGPQLEAMRAIIGLNPSWAEQPNVLRQNLSAITAATASAATASTAAGYLSDCSTSANLGDARGLFYSYWAAAQAASAAGAVSLAIPSGTAYAPGLIAAGIVYGVTNGLAIGLNDRLGRKLDCSTAESNATLVSAYPRKDPADTSVPGPYAPASSQASVDRLTAAAAGIDTTLTIITGVINTTTAKLTVVTNNLGLAKGNTDHIQETSMDLQTRAADLLSSIGTPTDHAIYSGSEPSGTANGLANTIDERQDTALSNTAKFQTLSVRLEIEESLVEPPKASVALFALPASHGGYIETVRDIVTSTIVNELAAGQSIKGNAEADLAAANDALAAGKYEDAFRLYAAAYRHAVG